MGKLEKYYCDERSCHKETEENATVVVASEGLMREYGNKRMWLCEKHNAEFIKKYNIENLDS